MKILFRLVALLVAASAAAEPFDCMVATTRQDASMDWWYAVPTQFTPTISRVDSVAKGEYFNIIPFFKNYGTTTNGDAKITYDIEIVRPDGSIDEAMQNCDGHDGPAALPNLLASRAVLRLCFDPEDPYGKYSINVIAIDHVACQTNRQTTTVEQKEFVVEKMTKDECDALFVQYPTAPNPARALSAFLQMKPSFFNEDNEPVWSAIWFFKTVFGNNEFLIPHLLQAFPDGTLKQQKDTILVLSLMNRMEELPKLSSELQIFARVMKAGRIPDPYGEITSGKQLDMLWAEYFATGRVQPIRQLLTALNLGEYAGTLDKIKAGELDPKALEVYREGMLEAVFQSALWSLRSNCKQSPLVFQYCVGILDTEELEKPAQACLAMLLKAVTEQPPKGHP